LFYTRETDVIERLNSEMISLVRLSAMVRRYGESLGKPAINRR